MIQEFSDDTQQDAHQQFQRWRRTHPTGFFINRESGTTYFLHTALCPHPGGTEWGGDTSASLTHKRKVCSTTITELEAWALARGLSIRHCHDCTPTQTFRSTYLIKWNPKRSPWPTLGRAVEAVRQKGFFDEAWFFSKSSRIRRGDRVFLLRTGIAPRGIMGAGAVIDEPSETFHWERIRKPNQAALSACVRFDTLLHPERDGILPTQHLAGFPPSLHAGIASISPSGAAELEMTWSAFLASHGQQPILLPEEVTTPARFFEGATRQISVNIYERNPHARQQCIQHYGCRCSVCDFDFEHIFGKLGRGFIHVHHIKPLSEIHKEYEIDPVADLRPICPNCHAMIHRNTEMMTIGELRDLIHGHVTSANKTVQRTGASRQGQCEVRASSAAGSRRCPLRSAKEDD